MRKRLRTLAGNDVDSDRLDEIGVADGVRCGTACRPGLHCLPSSRMAKPPLANEGRQLLVHAQREPLLSPIRRLSNTAAASFVSSTGFGPGLSSTWPGADINHELGRP